jgi:hypothetical protein
VNNAGRGMKYVSTHFMTEPPRFWEVDPETWRLSSTLTSTDLFSWRAAGGLSRVAGALTTLWRQLRMRGGRERTIDTGRKCPAFLK